MMNTKLIVTIFLLALGYHQSKTTADDVFSPANRVTFVNPETIRIHIQSNNANENVEIQVYVRTKRGWKPFAKKSTVKTNGARVFNKDLEVFDWPEGSYRMEFKFGGKKSRTKTREFKIVRSNNGSPDPQPEPSLDGVDEWELLDLADEDELALFNLHQGTDFTQAQYESVMDQFDLALVAAAFDGSFPAEDFELGVILIPDPTNSSQMITFSYWADDDELFYSHGDLEETELEFLPIE